MIAKAPAKINLHLRVGPPRADGFHPLLSWMCTVSLFDEIEFEKADVSRLQCNDATIPCDGENLIVKAAAALGVSSSIKLTKRIPAGGGLGGGSSDAATTLLALNWLYGLNRPQTEMARLASQLGSDVPFFLSGASAICTGLGEIVRPLPLTKPRWGLLIFPNFGVSTPQAYRRFDALGMGDSAALANEPDFVEWEQLGAKELLKHLVNDLERPAFELQPNLGPLRQMWEERLGRTVRMSGSGSTLFTLFDSETEARSAAVDGTAVVQLAPSLE